MDIPVKLWADAFSPDIWTFLPLAAKIALIDNLICDKRQKIIFQR